MTPMGVEAWGITPVVVKAGGGEKQSNARTKRGWRKERGENAEFAYSGARGGWSGAFAKRGEVESSMRWRDGEQESAGRAQLCEEGREEEVAG